MVRCCQKSVPGCSPWVSKGLEKPLGAVGTDRQKTSSLPLEQGWVVPESYLVLEPLCRWIQRALTLPLVTRWVWQSCLTALVQDQDQRYFLMTRVVAGQRNVQGRCSQGEPTLRVLGLKAGSTSFKDKPSHPILQDDFLKQAQPTNGIKVLSHCSQKSCFNWSK